MKKTVALYGLAGSLVVGAIAVDLLWPSDKPVDPPPPTVTPPPLPVIAPAPTVKPEGLVKLGDVISLEAALSNSYLRSGVENEVFLKIDLDAKQVEAGRRPPMALAIVIDRSGSMAGEKIDKAREAAKQLVDRLTEQDKLTIVSYATDYTVDLPLSSTAQRARIRQIIDQIFDGGGTNLSGGLEAGLKQLRRAAGDGMVSRLVLLSDGNANQGITDPKAIGRIAQRARLTGTTISSLGVGVDFNEDLMTLIAESAGGTYHYARNAEAIATALDKEFTGLVRLAARDIEVGFDLGEGVAIKEVYGYRTEVRRGRVTVPVGDMHGGLHRKIMVRLAVPGSSDGATAVAGLALSYSTVSGQDREFHGNLTAVSTGDMALLDKGERREVLESVETVLAAATRTQAVNNFRAGKKKAAIRVLKAQLAKTRKRASQLGSAALQSQAQEIEQALDGIDNLDAASTAGKALIKEEKHRAYNANVY